MTICKPRRSGAVTVEFAIVCLLLITFLLAIFEYGRYLMIRQLLNSAAREGVRLASANPSFKEQPAGSGTYVAQTLTTTDIQNTVLNYPFVSSLNNGSGTAMTASDIQVYRADPATGNAMSDSKGSTWTNASFGETIAVKIQSKYTPMFPTFGFLVNPDPDNFICMMKSEANN